MFRVWRLSMLASFQIGWQIALGRLFGVAAAPAAVMAAMIYSLRTRLVQLMLRLYVRTRMRSVATGSIFSCHSGTRRKFRGIQLPVWLEFVRLKFACFSTRGVAPVHA